MSRTFTQKLSAELDHNSEGTVHLYAEYEIHPDLRGLTLSFPITSRQKLRVDSQSLRDINVNGMGPRRIHGLGFDTT